MKLEHLFSPVSIGTLKLKNRIVMPPMATNYATPEGFVTDRQIAYYTARAQGGAGYLTVEHTGVLQQGKASPKMLLISTDEHIQGFKRLIDSVHDAGGKMVIQINHAGRQAASAVTGMPIVGPSPISIVAAPNPPKETIPHELTVREIEELVEAFTAAAVRVKKAGADGVELHMAHGYLICSFLSPFSNKRTDQYGGDIPGRAKFAKDVLRSVRNALGADFPIICRMSGDEYVEGGLKINETREFARILAKEGADALHISACNAVSGYLNHPPYYVQEGVFVHLAREIKSVVDIPVITVGRIRNPMMADRIIDEGGADLVSMGRALIADPNLPRKASEGMFEDITPCISCNRCIHTLRQGEVRCAVNPEAGNEYRFKILKTERPKKVWIVGGGPGGLKAAEIACMRGHEVTLFEKSAVLGGKMLLAAVPPKKEVLNDFMDYLKRRVKKVGVNVELGTEFTKRTVDEGNPDVLIVATGAKPRYPRWPGVKESGAISIEDVLSQKGQNLGRKILVIGGGGAGAETADYLSEMGKEVTLVEMLSAIAGDLAFHLQHYLQTRLKEKQVTILTSTLVKGLIKGGAVIEDASGQRKIDGFDSIVLAVGWNPDDQLAKDLEGRVPELYVIGDARKPREALDALFEAEEIALEI